MKFVKPEIFLIASTRLDNNEVARWLKHLGFQDETAHKFSSDLGKTEAERLIELAGRRCYLSFDASGVNPNVKKIRGDLKTYLENILASKHGSVLAHPTFTFAIEGISRVLTGELNRHGVGTAISEGSMRFIRYSDIPIVDVPSMQLSEEEQAYVEGGNQTTIIQKQNPLGLWHRVHTRQIIKNAVTKIEDFYKELTREWTEILDGPDFTGKKHITSMLRRIIPMGVATGGVWTFNVRALRHVLTMRCAEPAEEEICVVATKMLELMMQREPNLFGDFGKDEKGFYQPKFMKV